MARFFLYSRVCVTLYVLSASGGPPTLALCLCTLFGLPLRGARLRYPLLHPLSVTRRPRRLAIDAPEHGLNKILLKSKE
ncbi:hypothetical protein BDV93DRAFT_218618 [Ceratobasidium sp. AG-I]|nr:hypothetical protein BDV93DRAFT_218618 [Ceratobasidium sp. AG-I]